MRLAPERCLVIAMFALCGCAGSPRHPQLADPQLAKAEPVTAEPSAGEAIAEARCDRQVSCNNVGTDRRYSSLEDCLTRVWTGWQSDLVESECPNGIDPQQLDACLTDIRVLECSAELESLDMLPACAQLCSAEP